MWLRNRIVLQSTFVALLLLILGISGAWYVWRLQQLNSRVLELNVASIRAAEEISILAREMRNDLNHFRLTNDRTYLNQALADEPDVMSWLEQAKMTATTAPERQAMSQVEQDVAEFFQQLHRQADLPADSSSPDAKAFLVEDLLTAGVIASAGRYLDLNEYKLQENSRHNKALAERLAWVLLLLGMCGAIGGLVAGYGMARSLGRSILQLSVPIRDVAGKLNEVVGAIDLSVDPSLSDLEAVLQTLSDKVGAVVEQLHARHRELVRSDQLVAVGQLAAGLAHELRNPLMCMKTLVQAARRGGASAPLDARDLGVLDEEIARLDALLQGFLDFARPVERASGEVDLAPLIRQTVAFVGVKGKSRSVVIECRNLDEPLVAQVDSAQIRQVLLNLLLNALDAVESGGCIWVDAVRVAAAPAGGAAAVEGRRPICVRVEDNGAGLPAEVRDRIFEPFFSTKQTGLGLGLAISQRIVEAHHGRLAVLERPGGGTIFEVHLPTAP